MKVLPPTCKKGKLGTPKTAPKILYWIGDTCYQLYNIHNFIYIILKLNIVFVYSKRKEKRKGFFVLVFGSISFDGHF